MFTKNNLIFTFLCLVFGLSFSALSFAEAETQVIGRVLIATQGVTAQQPLGEVRQLARKAEIYLGDTLTTPAGGKAQIRLNDGELISLTPSTQLVLEDFSFDPQTENNTSVKNLVTGGLRSISGVVKGDGYQVKTRAGTIGIRGTAYEAYTQRGTNLFVRMQRGDVNVSNSQGEVTVGVNQPLAAARITSPNAKPEAVSFSALPKFFNQSFNAEATLGLAEEDADEAATTASTDNANQEISQEANQNTNQEAQVVAEVDSSVSQQELTNAEAFAPASINSTTNAEVSLVEDFSLAEDLATKIDQNDSRKAVEEISQNNPLPNIQKPGFQNNPNGNFRGYVLQETYNLEANETLYKNATGIIEAAYFKGAELTQDSNDFVSFLLGEAYRLNDGEVNTLASQPNTLQQLFDAPDINNLTFAGTGDIANVRPPISESEFDSVDSFNVWTVYDVFDLERVDIYYGYHIEKVDTGSAPSYKFSTFAFSEDVLLLDEVNNLPLNEEFTYTLRNPSERGLANQSELKVNFASKKVTADIKHNLINGVYSGVGSLANFYTNGIDLVNNDLTGFSGNIKGQLVSKNAKGAITLYELNSGDTQNFKAGLAVFTRQ